MLIFALDAGVQPLSLVEHRLAVGANRGFPVMEYAAQTRAT
jgi:hypothetical protein